MSLRILFVVLAIGPAISAIHLRSGPDETFPTVTAPSSQGLSIAGRVVFDGTSLSKPTDLTSMRIQIWNVADADLRMRIELGRAPNTLPPPSVVAPDGTFVLAGLSAGSYEIAVARVPSGWLARSAMFDRQDALDKGLTLLPGVEKLPELLVTLSDRHSRVSGMLRTADAQTLPTDFYVLVFPADRSLWRLPSRRVKTARIGADGSYAVSDLPEGNYSIVAIRGRIEPPTTALFQGSASAAVQFHLDEGERKQQDLRAS